MADERYRVGDRFGSWTLLKKLPPVNYTRRWQCVCDCGVVKVVTASNLTTGKSKRCGSCGAREREKLKRELT
jgi:hypothetical protein